MMNFENKSDTQKIINFNNESERQIRLKVSLIIIFSFIIFLFTTFGLFDWLSNRVSAFLLANLGYTNKWSFSFGPEWFIGLNRDIAALAGLPILLILMTIIILYYSFHNESKKLWRLVFIVVGGGIILITAKYFFAQNVKSEQFVLYSQTDYQFPSGHAMMGTIFYLTLAVIISRRHSIKTKRLSIISAVIIILIIGISRVLPGIHTLTEVIAGWSLGLIWLCLCWILEREIKKNVNRK